MNRIHDVVADYLGSRDWPWEERERLFVLPVAGESGTWTAYIEIREDEEQVLVHSVLGEEVPMDRLTEVALYLTRANFGLVIGNFELDLDTGQVRYKTSLDVEGAELTTALVDHVLLANIVTTDRYLPGLQAVADGADPDASVVAVERGS